MLRIGQSLNISSADADFMEPLGTAIEKVHVRLARSAAEVDAAQHLRYKVFYEEFKAKATPEMAAQRRDFDIYDDVADHLIVIDESISDPRQKIVGTYRLMRREAVDKVGGFYTSGEFDIAPLTSGNDTLLELGRSCVLAEYRTRPILQLLWQGITDYTLDHKIGLLFGCASLPGIDINTLSRQLAYLHHYHLAPSGMCPRALPARFVNMNLHDKDSLDARATFNSLPPLIKGYLRAGGFIGEGAVIDEQFNTTDVCIVFPMKTITERYRKFYAKKTNRDVPAAKDADESADSILDSGLLGNPA